MAVVTGIAVVLIVRAPLVLTVRSRLRVFVAKNALENGKVRGIVVTVRTLIPFVAMSPGIDREVLRIVIPVRWRPRCSRMTALAISRELSCRVIGIRGTVVC